MWCLLLKRLGSELHYCLRPRASLFAENHVGTVARFDFRVLQRQELLVKPTKLVLRGLAKELDVDEASKQVPERVQDPRCGEDRMAYCAGPPRRRALAPISDVDGIIGTSLSILNRGLHGLFVDTRSPYFAQEGLGHVIKKTGTLKIANRVQSGWHPPPGRWTIRMSSAQQPSS